MVQCCGEIQLASYIQPKSTGVLPVSNKPASRQEKESTQQANQSYDHGRKWF